MSAYRLGRPHQFAFLKLFEQSLRARRRVFIVDRVDAHDFGHDLLEGLSARQINIAVSFSW
jgi:hypothetical protein